MKKWGEALSGKDLESENYIVTTREICAILNLKARRIQQLSDEGALVRSSHGKYDLPASIQSYLKWQEEKITEADGDMNKVREETLWIRARRKKSEAEYQIMTGELHRSKDIEEIMNAMMTSFRSQLLAFPTKAAAKVVGETDTLAVREILKTEIYEVMEELSDYDADVFYGQSDDKIYIEEPEEISDGKES